MVINRATITPLKQLFNASKTVIPQEKAESFAPQLMASKEMSGRIATLA